MKKITCLLCFIFILNSCGVNEEIAVEAKSKSTTYTQKVDIEEVLTQLKSRNPELASFIEDNPVSNLKNKSGKTDYYFDLKNVYAIKNNKNEAAYTIPLYIDDESDYLTRLSVEITPTSVQANLIIIQANDDGTLMYTGHSFNDYKKKSLTSKTAQIDCYCVTIVSDCTCHKTHASSGCDHPAVDTSCSCSGSAPVGGGSYGTGTKTTWSAGSGSSTSYTLSASGIILGLQKHFKPDYTIPPLLKYTIEQNVTYGKMLLDFLNEETSTPVNKAFVIQMLLNMEDGQFTTTKQVRNSIENFKYSQKSPFNVDLSSILDNQTLAENQKFKAVYTALTASPKFQKLFLDIFEDNTKYNVRFEIDEHVYEDNDPTKKEVNATTSQDPVTKNITIKVSKQILIPDTGQSQTNIENAKTILHECIHAYLFVKANNPAIGANFVEILNMMYPRVNEQHDFMYNRMVPTMQQVLSEIRDLVTTEVRRADVADLKIYTKSDLSAFEIWNWNNYYKYISINGLEEANCYKTDFPNPSDSLFLLGNYINSGRTRLDKN